MKYNVIINNVLYTTISTKNPHGYLREYLLECILSGMKVEIVAA